MHAELCVHALELFLLDIAARGALRLQKAEQRRCMDVRFGQKLLWVDILDLDWLAASL